jgi:hypothetical protein
MRLAFHAFFFWLCALACAPSRGEKSPAIPRLGVLFPAGILESCRSGLTE